MKDYKLTDFAKEDQFELHSYLTYLFEKIVASVPAQEQVEINE